MIQYPNLTYALRELAGDNGMLMKPDHDWQWPENAAELEAFAAKMTQQELETIAAGEQDEQAAVIERYEAWPLDKFLAEALDGDLTENFFVD